MVAAALGRHEEAMAFGHESRKLLRRQLGWWFTKKDEPTSALIRCCTDLSVIAAQSQRFDEAVNLASEAVSLCTSRPKKGEQRETDLGTALHNLSAAYAGRAMAVLRETQVPGDLQAAMGDLQSARQACDRAVDVRRKAATPVLALSRWELANSLLQRARLLLLMGKPGEAARDISQVLESVAELGPLGAELAQHAYALAQHVQH
jgi:tetratricopeptide (TPR) repeat protein